MRYRRLRGRRGPRRSMVIRRASAGLRPTPWLVPDAVPFLESLLHPTAAVLEFGCGGSTVWFAARAGRVVSIEHSAEWHGRISALVPQVDLRLLPRPYAGICSSFDDESFDVVLVDGRDRVACIREGHRLVRRGGWLVLDNAERLRYAAAYDQLAGWERRSFESATGGSSPEGNGPWRTDFFRRPEG